MRTSEASNTEDQPNVATPDELFEVTDTWLCSGCFAPRKFSAYATAQWHVDTLSYTCTCGCITTFDAGLVIDVEMPEKD